MNAKRRLKKLEQLEQVKATEDVMTEIVMIWGAEPCYATISGKTYTKAEFTEIEKGWKANGEKIVWLDMFRVNNGNQ